MDSVHSCLRLVIDSASFPGRTLTCQQQNRRVSVSLRVVGCVFFVCNPGPVVPVSSPVRLPRVPRSELAGACCGTGSQAAIGQRRFASHQRRVTLLAAMVGSASQHVPFAPTKPVIGQ